MRSPAGPALFLTAWALQALSAVGASAHVASDAVSAVAVGDAGVFRVDLINREVIGVPARLGSEGAGLEHEIPGHSTWSVWVECGGRPDAVPELFARMEARTRPVDGLRQAAAPGSPPALYLSRAPAGRAALAAQLAGARPGLDLKWLSPAEVPPSFAALRWAPIVALDVDVLEALSEGARRALWRAAAAGAVVVVGVGAGEPPGPELTRPLGVTFGDTLRPASGLVHAEPQVRRQRALRIARAPDGGWVSGIGEPRVVAMADGESVAVARSYGLGEVRTLAFPVSELSGGVVTEAVFAPGPDALEQALAWLDAAPPVHAPRALALGPLPWALIGLLVMCGLVARWLPRVAGVVGLTAALAAVAAPPAAGEAARSRGRALLIPAGDEALALVSEDVTFPRGGAQSEPAPPVVALDAASPNGVCLLSDGERSAWLLAVLPGANRRLRYATFRSPPSERLPSDEALPSWPPGPLGGAPLHRLPGAAAGFPATTEAEVRLVELPTAPDAPPPLELTAPSLP